MGLGLMSLGTLASCGGNKTSFSLNVDDPVLNYSEKSKGFKIKLAEGYKFDGRPEVNDYKFNCDKADKMKFEAYPFDRDNPSNTIWYAYPSEAGTYKVSMTVFGVRSTNELTLTVKDGQYPEFSFKLPTNIQITFVTKDESVNGMYKLGDKYCSFSNGRPAAYIPDISKKYYYGYRVNDQGEREWRKVNRDPSGIYKGMISNYNGLPTCEYTTKREGTTTIDGQAYPTATYSFFDGSVYEVIVTDTLSIVSQRIVDGVNVYKVTKIDLNVTKMPDEFNLPE